ncbi:hypothetical protein NEF87_000913 [Candidatus Lokiarchaeum ossiferum]|uniref:HTH tetR-type domain-containing protein n=1 Tax=Candidatus Lokiarchaeum ossiferum TaxID=2951803 RepID=A0ABY6HMU6_9ARCH|nr:hypothetical protein NEF87_000913 [Candidatus Lokiarchaeum sp. B-35]
MEKPADQSRNLKQKLIEICCQMIDEKKGLNNISLRSIARKAGCAHTNIYNFFGDFNSFLYAAMIHTMENIILFTQKQVGTRARNFEHFPAFIDAQIDFAHQHEGLFRFIWLEKIEEPIPLRVTQFSEELKKRFAELVYNSMQEKVPRNAAYEISYILHSYLHGELCKFITRRTIGMTFDKFKVELNGNIQKMMFLLMESYEKFIG